MTRHNFIRAMIAPVLFASHLSFSSAESPVPSKKTDAGTSWDTARTTSPESVDELKALQSRVKTLQKKALPATVGLLLGTEEEQRSGVSCGSGVIISEDGLVLTAAHVILQPNQPVEFVLSNGKKVNGVTLGMNPTNDSGMAKITDAPPKSFEAAKDGKWPFVEMGKSENLQKGQWIVSMGHPGGPKPERPPPIRVGRYIGLEKAGFGQRNDLLNTDATLVGGDSGGPLFDLDGKVIGIHSEIGMTLSENRHVPIEKFVTEWDRMKRGDMIFGSIRERDRATKVAMNVVFDDTVKDAARILEVIAGGVAEKAGIEVGDVIKVWNGKAVANSEDLRSLLPSHKPGDIVKLEIDRKGETLKFEIKLVAKSRR